MPVLDQIFACIVKSDLNRLIHYLKKDPSLVNAKEEQGISLLHYAVLLDKPEIVIYLSNNIECNLSPQENVRLFRLSVLRMIVLVALWPHPLARGLFP
jgi:hypothetical protein